VCEADKAVHNALLHHGNFYTPNCPLLQLPFWMSTIVLYEITPAEIARRPHNTMLNLKTCSALSSPSSAITTSPPTLDTALLIADATPESSPGTEVITVVVKGATVVTKPKPNNKYAGQSNM
jgi:hypothetical protein